MTTMTRPAAPAANQELLSAAVRSSERNRFGRSSQASLTGVELVALSSFLVAVAASLELGLWLLLPIAPAVLLRCAGREVRGSCAKRVMRVFSVATLAAMAVQAMTMEPSVGIATTIVAATLVFLGAVERIGASDVQTPAVGSRA